MTPFEQQAEQFTQFLSVINKNLSGLANGFGIGGKKPLEKKYDPSGKRIPPPLAVLPKHLLPKALGGDVGDDDLDLDDGNGLTANKKNMLSTMKKIKNKDQ